MDFVLLSEFVNTDLSFLNDKKFLVMIRDKHGSISVLCNILGRKLVRNLQIAGIVKLRYVTSKTVEAFQFPEPSQEKLANVYEL